MRLLIVNPNTSAGVTARINAAARAVAAPGDRLTTTRAAFGPELIVTEADAAEAARGVLATVSAHQNPVDGIILASFGDTGAEAVRQAYPGQPVVGIAGAAFATAFALGGRPAIVTFARPVTASLRDMAMRYGLADRLACVASLALDDAGDPGRVQDNHGPALVALVQDVARSGATSIVMGGGPLAGFAATVRDTIDVPVIDGVQAAIGMIRVTTGASAGYSRRKA